MDAILDTVRRSPKLKSYVDELNELLRREEEARRRFRQNLNEDVREEFINGEVIGQMTARDAHTTTISSVESLLRAFVLVRKLGAVRRGQALTAFPRNDYAPDICFWGIEKSSAFTAATTLYPVPDFICEILSDSTEAGDRGVKFEDYAAHGVEEYWIVDPEARMIEQYTARDGLYELVGKFTSGTVRSRAIAQFELPVPAAFDEAANLDALRKLLS